MPKAVFTVPVLYASSAVRPDGYRYVKGSETIRINTADVYANGIPTIRELNAANSINQKTGGNIILIPKGEGIGNLPQILEID